MQIVGSEPEARLATTFYLIHSLRCEPQALRQIGAYIQFDLHANFPCAFLTSIYAYHLQRVWRRILDIREIFPVLHLCEEKLHKTRHKRAALFAEKISMQIVGSEPEAVETYSESGEEHAICAKFSRIPSLRGKITQD